MASAHFTTRILERKEYELWDHLVKNSSTGSIFALSEWLNITERSLNTKFDIIGCFFDERIVGGCPIFHCKGFGILPFFSNTKGMMPFSGVVLEDFPKENVRKYEHQYQNSLSAIAEHLEKLKLKSIKIQITNPQNIIDVRPFIWRGWKCTIRYFYSLDLMKLNYSNDVKRNISKAIKNGVIICTSSDIDLYYSLFEEMFIRQGLKPPVTKKYLQNFYDFIIKNEMGEMWIALTPDEKWIAAEIFLNDQNYVHRWTAATDITLRKNGGYHLLLDTVFKHYKGTGRKNINLMAGNTPQLAEFITGFNPNLVPYYSLQTGYFLL